MPVCSFHSSLSGLLIVRFLMWGWEPDWAVASSELVILSTTIFAICLLITPPGLHLLEWLERELLFHPEQPESLSKHALGEYVCTIAHWGCKYLRLRYVCTFLAHFLTFKNSAILFYKESVYFCILNSKPILAWELHQILTITRHQKFSILTPYSYWHINVFTKLSIKCRQTG